MIITTFVNYSQRRGYVFYGLQLQKFNISNHICRTVYKEISHVAVGQIYLNQQSKEFSDVNKLLPLIFANGFNIFILCYSLFDLLIH